MNRFAILGGILLVTCICGLMISGIWPGSASQDQVTASPPDGVSVDKGQAKKDELRAIFEKANAAHGPDYLDTHQGIHISAKGYLILLGNKCKFASERTFKKPDKMREAISMLVRGVHVETVTLFDGKKLQVFVNDAPLPINAKAVDCVRQEAVYALSTLTDFQKPPYTLTSLGVVNLGTSEANGVRVSRPEWKDATLYFDTTSHLLSKVETRAYDFDLKREVTSARFVLEYVDKGGRRIERRVREHRNGALFGETEITAYEPLDNIDETLFTDP